MEEEEDWFLKNAIRVDDKVEWRPCADPDAPLPHYCSKFATVFGYYGLSGITCSRVDVKYIC